LHAADEIEKSENLSQLPDKKWIAQLIKPGTSLGGARPKACVIDEKGNLTVAKFPSRNDDYDVGLWEHFCCLLAKKAGINVAETRIIDTGQKYHTLLSRRFDRDNNGRRIHFASSLTMLGFQDGDGSRTGKGYLDIVDFILQNGGNVTSDLEQLFARVAFNICVGNCDDHFRNHGFLLTKNGWQLSPAYDLNPSLSYDHAIMITDNTNHSDLQMLYNNCESYMLEPPKAKEIIQRVCDAVSDWQRLAVKLQIAKAEMEMFRRRFEEGCNIKYGL
ncbi:MAG: HipA domain-containing protein, partial [Bacteroidales bacterium]|nr:HipA domain-containing protein [Bacteroidales bacterium]